MAKKETIVKYDFSVNGLEGEVEGEFETPMEACEALRELADLEVGSVIELTQGETTLHFRLGAFGVSILKGGN